MSEAITLGDFLALAAEAVGVGADEAEGTESAEGARLRVRVRAAALEVPARMLLSGHEEGASTRRVLLALPGRERAGNYGRIGRVQVELARQQGDRA